MIILRRLVLAVALLSAMPAAAADWSHAKPVTVVMREYQFAPSQLVLRRGVAYRLHLENRGKEQHEFTAPEFFKAAQLRNPEVLNADRTEAEIPPGAAKDLYVLASRSGQFELRCSDHDWAGMTGKIVVK